MTKLARNTKEEIFVATLVDMVKANRSSSCNKIILTALSNLQLKKNYTQPFSDVIEGFVEYKQEEEAEFAHIDFEKDNFSLGERMSKQELKDEDVSPFHDTLKRKFSFDSAEEPIQEEAGIIGQQIQNEISKLGTIDFRTQLALMAALDDATIYLKNQGEQKENKKINILESSSLSSVEWIDLHNDLFDALYNTNESSANLNDLASYFSKIMPTKGISTFISNPDINFSGTKFSPKRGKSVFSLIPTRSIKELAKAEKITLAKEHYDLDYLRCVKIIEKLPIDSQEKLNSPDANILYRVSQNISWLLNNGIAAPKQLRELA